MIRTTINDDIKEFVHSKLSEIDDKLIALIDDIAENGLSCDEILPLLRELKDSIY